VQLAASECAKSCSQLRSFSERSFITLSLPPAQRTTPPSPEQDRLFSVKPLIGSKSHRQHLPYVTARATMLVAVSRFIRSGHSCCTATRRYPRIVPIASHSCCNFDQIREHGAQ
jgi:hypothetical protein